LLLGAAVWEAAAAIGHVLSAIERQDTSDRRLVRSAMAGVEEALAG
jgi:hypothetical protein